MARSMYIYLVVTMIGIENAFTVKHEMESYLKRRNKTPFTSILRLADNPSTVKPPTDMTEEFSELL